VESTVGYECEKATKNAYGVIREKEKLVILKKFLQHATVSTIRF
jgi:hypothetical protein